MSNLESIVPPLELCKLIPEGEFEDSALVWMYRPALKGISDTPFMVDMRVKAEYLNRERYPAPTMDEIIIDLPDEYEDGILVIGKNYIEYCSVDGFVVDGTNFCSNEEGIVDSAIMVWFKVKGIEVK